MMNQSSARSWAMLSCVGLLTYAAGCQTQTSPNDDASSAAVSPVQPSEAVDHTTKRAERAIDGDVQQTSHDIDAALGAPSAVAPTVDQAVVKVDKSVKDVANDLKSNATQAAGEISQGVADEVTQAADGLRQKAVAGTRKTTDDFLNKLDSEANSALNRAKSEVKKQLGKGR